MVEHTIEHMADEAVTVEPTSGWASGALGAVQVADCEIARQTAVRARAIAAFAATRPASGDRPAGQPGCMSEQRQAARPAVLVEVSEWAAQELVLALEISSEAANVLLERSLMLVHRLPRTLAALESGALHVGHLFPMLERVAPIADDEKRAEVERRLLDWMAGRVTTPAQLAAKARRLGLLVDARDSARRLAEALLERGVSARPDRRDGMAHAVALLTVPEAAALIDALDRCADALDEPGDERTRGQKMADCLLDLVLRPGENGLAPVQAQLTVVAAVSTLAGGDEPGEIAGQVVPAEMVRALACALGLLGPAVDTAGPTVTGPVSGAEERALEVWWAEAEDRVLFEEWGGGEEPPVEELARHWAREARWQALPAAGDHSYQSVGGASRTPLPDVERTPDPASAGESDGDRYDEPSGPVAPPTWVAADEAVTHAGLTLLEFDRALGRADAAVRRAEIADAADEAAWHESAAGRSSAAADTVEAMREAGDTHRAALAGLLDATAGGALVDRPRIAVVDALSGALVALTDSRELRRAATCGRAECGRRPARCAHDLCGRPPFGPPGPADGYRPAAALDRYLRARDRRCRFPGCRRPVPRGGELDHDRPWPDGETSARNLVGYCTSHHRGKHQAPGWRHELAADGALTVTTPTGLVAGTTPAPY